MGWTQQGLIVTAWNLEENCWGSLLAKFNETVRVYVDKYSGCWWQELMGNLPLIWKVSDRDQGEELSWKSAKPVNFCLGAGEGSEKMWTGITSHLQGWELPSPGGWQAARLGKALCTAEGLAIFEEVKKGVKWHIWVFSAWQFLKNKIQILLFATGWCGEPNKKKQLKHHVEKQAMQSGDLGLCDVSLPSIVQVKWKIESIHLTNHFLFSLRAG